MIKRLWQMFPEDWRHEFAAWRAEVWLEKGKRAFAKVEFWRARAGQ